MLEHDSSSDDCKDPMEVAERDTGRTPRDQGQQGPPSPRSVIRASPASASSFAVCTCWGRVCWESCNKAWPKGPPLPQPTTMTTQHRLMTTCTGQQLLMRNPKRGRRPAFTSWNPASESSFGVIQGRSWGQPHMLPTEAWVPSGSSASGSEEARLHTVNRTGSPRSPVCRSIPTSENPHILQVPCRRSPCIPCLQSDQQTSGVRIVPGAVPGMGPASLAGKKFGDARTSELQHGIPKHVQRTYRRAR